MINLIVTIIIGVLLGDLFAGIFHWWEDRYGRPEWPIVGELVVKHNINHHMNPASIGKESYLANCGPSMIALSPLILLSWYCGLYWLMAGFIVASQANQVHCWAHKKSNRFVRFFQSFGLFLSPEHHAVHHKQPYTQRYCVVTNYLNPILHAVRFWDMLEWMVWALIGVKTNPERETY